MLSFSDFGKFIDDIRLDSKQLPFNLRHDIMNKAKNGIEPVPKTSSTTNQASNQSPVTSVPDVDRDSGFRFGSKSRTELNGVLPIMVRVAELALRYSTQDFMIFDGLRTPEEQKKLVARGVSKTLNSKHLMQWDGYSHAFDAVPVVGTIPKWDWELSYPVAFAVDQAATELGVANKIRWGGAWDRTLADFGGRVDAYERVVREYCERHPGKDFIDGPHFEWIG